MTPSGRHTKDVPCAVLVEAVRAAGLSYRDVAERLGWYDKTAPDMNRVMRVLGLRGDKGATRTHVRHPTAERILAAIDSDLTTVPPGARCEECGSDMLLPSEDGLCGFCRDEQAMAA